MKKRLNERKLNREQQTHKKRSARFYFSEMFEKYGLRERQRFIVFARWAIFAILAVVIGLMIMQHVDEFEIRDGWKTLSVLIAFASLLFITQIMKLLPTRKRSYFRYVVYLVEAVAACAFTLITNSTSAMFVYILLLTEYYIGLEKKGKSLVLFICAVGLYVFGFLLQNYTVLTSPMDAFRILTRTISSVFVLLVHFIVVQIALTFYNQFLRLDVAMKALAESKKELEKAYAAVAEVTALEERQRIAKEIHDTAGHSLTTVIMQTESAKMMLDKNPAQAKSKIIAANLQAKHALEELRNSVHLLSGRTGNQTLKSSLQDVIHDSTDGTGITIRSDIDDVTVSEAKYRFLCNTLKEGISNGLRHGGATAFWFELKEEKGKIRFLLSDNGKGVDMEKLQIGFGLTAMKDRAKALGGEVRFSSEIDEGFELELTMQADNKPQYTPKLKEKTLCKIPFAYSLRTTKKSLR